LPVLDLVVWGLIVAFVVHVTVRLYAVHVDDASEPYGG